MTVRGAYGLSLPDLPGERWLNPAARSWPAWRFETREEAAGRDALVSEGKVAVVRTTTGHAERIDGHQGVTTLYGATGIPAAAYPHPLLANTAASCAEWSGRLCFHAGAFLDEGERAWGLLGHREQGKSSTLAWLAAHGVPVVADDLVITDGENVMAGPRCVDLREPAAHALGLGEDVGLLGKRRRWRLPLPPIEPEVPLAGWIALAWSDGLGVREIDRSVRGSMLAESLTLAVKAHAMPWLGALGRPMLELSRPRSWDRVGDAMGLLLERVESFR